MKHRTQLMLEGNHSVYLKRRAKALGVSVSACLRQVVEEKIREENRRRKAIDDDPMRAMVGAYAGARASTGRKADEILYGKD